MRLVAIGMAVYYAAGVAFSAIAAHQVAGGGSFASAVSALEPWQSLVLVPAALLVLAGFAAYASAAWRMTERQRAEGRAAVAAHAPASTRARSRDASGAGARRRLRATSCRSG